MFDGNSTFSHGNSFETGSSYDRSSAYVGRWSNLEPFFWKYLARIQDTI